MAKPDADWRLQGQEQYLTGVSLVRKTWSQARPDWGHDHCEFCGRKFLATGTADSQAEGYTTEDEYYWVCNQCFEDFKDKFKWQVTD